MIFAVQFVLHYIPVVLSIVLNAWYCVYEHIFPKIDLGMMNYQHHFLSLFTDPGINLP